MAQALARALPAEAELAEAVIEAFPSMDKVRFVSSGTEATMSAIRLARAFTGRKYIVKFEGCYHGHADSLLVKAGSGVATLGIPGSAGVLDEQAKFTLALPFNSQQVVEEAFTKFKEQIACVIVEPVVGNMGCVPPLEGYLEFLRRITAQHGTVLIFDEVMTGFRLSFGGAQQLYKIKPDLTTLGKMLHCHSTTSRQCKSVSKFNEQIACVIVEPVVGNMVVCLRVRAIWNFCAPSPRSTALC